MSLGGDVRVLKACPVGPLVEGVICSGLAILCWAAAPSLYDENFLLHKVAWLGLLFAAVAAPSFCQAYRRTPILRIDDDGVEVESLTERRRWRWTQTGPFVISPPLGGGTPNLSMAAMFPGNVAPYERAAGRTAPSFVDADITIGIAPYVTRSETDGIDQAAQAILDQVNDRRVAALRVRPLDAAYTGPTAGQSRRLTAALVSRRLRFYVPICISLLVVLHSCGRIFLR